MAGELVVSSSELPKKLKVLTDAKVVGGKAAGLAKLTQLGLRAPPWLTITTRVSRYFNKNQKLPNELGKEIKRFLPLIEKQTNKVLGDREKPLLVSVRSGAMVSMPGMMDTILNVGLNPETVVGLSKSIGQRAALDCYCRFLSMYAKTVLGHAEHGSQISIDLKLNEHKLRELCVAYKNAFQRAVGYAIPDDPYDQLAAAIKAVLKSWNNPRAVEYRKINNIPHNLGTAVTIQQMVYGNMNNNSGAGVVFSQNVRTREAGLDGEFIIGAQGEDVVSGTRTPRPITEMKSWNQPLYNELEKVAQKLEGYYENIVEVEFTIENGILYALQCRVAKGTLEAAIEFAIKMVEESRWSKDEAIQKVMIDHNPQVERSEFNKEAVNNRKRASFFVSGLPASPGAMVGIAVFSSKKAIELSSKGMNVVLMRPDTSPDDLPGMIVASAIVTGAGGATSHAAVVARDLGKPAVVGVSKLVFSDRGAASDNLRLEEGDAVSVDGDSGLVFGGALPYETTKKTKAMQIFLTWLDERKEKKAGQVKPRITFKHFGTDKNWMTKRLSVNELLNDFYISEAMARHSKGSSLEMEAEKLRDKIHLRAAEVLAFYLAIAVGGELRHAYLDHYSEERISPSFAYLKDNFSIVTGGDRSRIQNKVIETLCRADAATQIKFFKEAAAVFSSQCWEEGYGGRPWAKIARAPLKLLTGEIKLATFIDHVFDLEHHGEQLFDKHPCVAVSTNEELLEEQLGIKKSSRTISRLFCDLTESVKVSKAVQKLWSKGVAMGLWKKGD